jgi:nanoRNase/pAp phosphatase (c-di-AMP/oligoRNAs hydrolase)
MTFHEILQTLQETQAQRVLLLCHHNSDPDAICSAYAFQQLLLKARPDLQIEIGAGQGVSKLTKNLLGYIPATVNFSPDVEAAQVLILLDTNTVQQLDNLADAVSKSSAPLILIDHHAPHPETIAAAKVAIVDDQAPSTCNIVYNLYREQGVKPNLDEARALFLGMAFDTRHFVLANGATFRAVADMLESGLDTQEALSMLGVPMDLSERVARVKAFQRAKIVRIDNWIIALTYVSAFQASAARAITDLGAHMSAVAGKKDDGIEISMRCTREFCEKTGIHLGKDIANPLGEALGGQGGGHAMAAGVNAKGEPKDALKRCLGLLKAKLAKLE